MMPRRLSEIGRPACHCGSLSTETPDLISPGMEKLQAGERAAIFQAESIEADIVIIDEKAARLVAAQGDSLLPGHWVYSERPRPAGSWIWRVRSTNSGEPASAVPPPCSRRFWSGTVCGRFSRLLSRPWIEEMRSPRGYPRPLSKYKTLAKSAASSTGVSFREQS